MRACVLLLSLLSCFAAQADLETWVPRAATLEIRWHNDSLAELKLSAATPIARHALIVPKNMRLQMSNGQAHVLHGDAFTLPQALELLWRGRQLRIPDPSLQISDGQAFAFNLVDARQRAWLQFDHAIPQRRTDSTTVAWQHYDVRIGPALAARMGDHGLTGSPLAAARIEMQLQEAPAKALLGCATPNFPNGGSFIADVALTEIDSADATCNGSCSGFGAPNGRVKMTPSAKLQGVGTADVPWYEKFMTSPHNYPYPGNDQHPILVWSVYRINGQGQIEQLARSGAKHAFYSGNQFPNGGNNCGCGPANVLWSGCTDTYGWSTNDWSAVLAPRHEIIPARGQWGRCGSLRDADCNGSDDSPFFSTFDYRAVVPEAAIAPAQNPGAQWFIEAWYIVRDDSNLSNSFGHRRIVPTWSPLPTAKWMLRFYENIEGPNFPFVSGPAIDQWLAPGTTTANAMSRDLATADGRMRLSVKVVAIGGGRYRYDYALMNFDFMRATTSGAEPNLTVLSNLGIGAFAVPLASFAGTSVDMQLGEAVSNAVWNVEHNGGSLRMFAAPGDSQSWGALYRFSVSTNLPPETGVATITPAAAGVPASFSIDTLVPSASEVLFTSGFE